MKKIKFILLSVVLPLILVVSFSACANDTKDLKKRISDLEAEIETLKNEVVSKTELDRAKNELDFYAAAYSVVVLIDQEITGSPQVYVRFVNFNPDLFESLSYKFLTDFEMLDEKPNDYLYARANYFSPGIYEFEITIKSKYDNFTVVRVLPFTLK